MVGPREATALVGCCHKNRSQNRRFQDPRRGRVEGPTPEGVKPDLVRCFILFRESQPPHGRPFFYRSCESWSPPIPQPPIIQRSTPPGRSKEPSAREGRLLFMSRFDVCSAVLDTGGSLAESMARNEAVRDCLGF